jgi:cytochrome c oxidase subunit IV
MTTEHAAASMTSDAAHIDEHGTSDHAVDIDKHVRVYITVFVALMVLTVITVAISYLDLAVPTAVTVALFVAIVKGGLVAGYFMHLVSEKKLIYAVLIVTVAFFAVLLALPVLTHSNGYWIPE